MVAARMTMADLGMPGAPFEVTKEIVPQIPMTSAMTTRPDNELANLSTVNLLEVAPTLGAVVLSFFG